MMENWLRKPSINKHTTSTYAHIECFWAEARKIIPLRCKTDLRRKSSLSINVCPEEKNGGFTVQQIRTSSLENLLYNVRPVAALIILPISAVWSDTLLFSLSFLGHLLILSHEFVKTHRLECIYIGRGVPKTGFLAVGLSYFVCL